MRNRNAAFFAAGGFVAALFLTGAARAITDTIFKYSTPQKGYLGFPPAAFAPGNGGNTFYNVYNDGTVLQVATNYTCVNAPINLPQGAIITQVSGRYAKVNGSNALLTIVTSNDVTDAETMLLSYSLPDTNSAQVFFHRPITGAAARINNGSNTYWLRFCADQGNYFNNMRIAYTYGTAGD